MANNKKENKIEKFTKEAIGKTLNQFNKEIGVADLVEINKNQDRILNGILSQVNDENTEKTEKSNIITLDNSTDGVVELKEIQGDTNVNVSKIKEDMPITHDIGEKEGNIFTLNEVTQGAINIGEIQGNTMVNCNKDDKKELVLMKDLSTQGDNTVTITEGVDGGLVDIALEGNTLVNVSKTKDSTAITKAYTVENSGNHIALQGDVDGNCRPVITGKTLWIDNDTEEVLTAFDEARNLRLQSTFEDNLVTQEMVDSGEEVAENLGKYRVDYKSTQEDGTVGSTKTLYLNSPLLEGDTIEEKDGGVYHVHRYTKVVLDGSDVNKIIYYPDNSTGNTAIFTIQVDNPKSGGLYLCDKFINFDGNIWNVAIRNDKECINVPRDTVNVILSISKNKLSSINSNGLCLYLQSNPITVVYELAEPRYELIEQSNLVIPSYANGHLDFDTAVPVEKVEFLPFSEELTYLYANTQYTVQFTSDRATTADIKLGGTSLLAQSIVAGLNKITMTTPSELVDNKLLISGVGAKISEVVVTDTNREFGYFEGMKSVGEGGNLVITSSNSDNSLSNNQTLTHVPLRAVGGVKDRYVLIDGNWYIERKCGIRTYQEGDKDNYKTDLINTVYPLEIPAYDEIDYNPLEVYSGTTRITTNSTVPTNIIVKNHGFNCLLKPSTTYTISSNLGLNTVTTPSTLTEDCLRFMDTDTSDVTTMKDMLVLEGDWTTKADLIPTNFSGIESAFEQQLVTDKKDVNYGKYKVTAKVIGKNLFDKEDNWIKGQYLDAYDIIKFNDGAYYNPKYLKVNPNETYYSIHKDGTPMNISYLNLYDKNKNFIKMINDTSQFTIPSNVYYIRVTIWINNIGDNEVIGKNFIGNSTTYEPYKENNITFYINEPLRGVGDVKDKVYVKDDKVIVQRNCGIRPYEDGDFGTHLTDKVNTVYPLAEPTYEEVEYSSNRLILDTFNNESFNNSTLFLDTTILPKLSFKPLYEELVYVKNSTKYYIQFNAVGSGEVVINLGGTELTTEIVEGYNCIPITTPSESTNLMTMIGQGITISEVVVSEVVCGGYYKGLQSCFEEHMENGKYRVLLRGIALDGSKVNGIKLYINEPLRGIEGIKDRLCIKNGKLMVERKCGEIVFDGSDDENWDILLFNFVNHTKAITRNIPNLKGTDNYSLANSYCDKFIQLAESPNFGNDTQEYYAISASKIEISINNSKLSSPNVNGIKKWLQQNPTKITYELATPVYEEATNEYGLPIVFEGYENGIVYIDSAVTPTTHIKYTSNNQLATTLAEAEEQNIATQEDINMNVVTYMMDIDMILTEMEMSNDISVMAVRRDSSNENMLDRMSEEDKKVYRDNTVVMLEKMITANVLEKEDIEGRINMYYNKNRISKEQYEYLKSLL